MTEQPTEPDNKNPQSLWNLMQRGGESSSQAQQSSEQPDQQTANSDELEGDGDVGVESLSENETSVENVENKAGKGLWSVMGVNEDSSSVVSSIHPPDENPSDTPSPLTPEVADSHRKPPIETKAKPDDFLSLEPAADAPATVETSEPVLDSADYQEQETHVRHRRPQPGTRNYGMACLILGIIALPLSGLSLMESFLAKLPGSVIGLCAVLVAVMAFDELRRREITMTALMFPFIGILCGIIAMFSGPLFLSSWGDNYRDNQNRTETITHLQQIGTALNDYHRQEGHFPSAGWFDGKQKGDEQNTGHSWQTRLLPYLGLQEIYNKIDLTQPYHHASNLPAMSTEITLFYAAGVTPARLGNGFAVTHFAGVGGETFSPEVGAIHWGIFGSSRPVSKNDIIDGLSQTFIAGELSGNYPAWGEPENFRTIEQGLNKDFSGFGNSEGTGAMFLKADGSVQFVSNAISTDIVRSMSTRDGREPLNDPFR